MMHAIIKLVSSLTRISLVRGVITRDDTFSSLVLQQDRASPKKCDAFILEHAAAAVSWCGRANLPKW